MFSVPHIAVKGFIAYLVEYRTCNSPKFQTGNNFRIASLLCPLGGNKLLCEMFLIEKKEFFNTNNH